MSPRSDGSGLRWVRWTHATLRPSRRRRCTAASIAAHVEPQPRTQQVGVVASPTTSTGGMSRAMPATLAARRSTIAGGSPACRRCCRCRPPSRCRRCGASARACRGSPTGGRASRDRGGTARTPGCRRRRCGSARWRTARRCRAASSTSGSCHGSEPLARKPSDSRITGVRYLTAMRTASIAASKQCTGLYAATTGSGASPERPNRAMLRSAASVFVGRPVDGPPRWMSTISSGSSTRDGERDRLALQHHAGPLVVVTPRWPAKAAPRAMPTAAISSSACTVRTPKCLCLDSSWRMSEAGVIGYEPSVTGSLASWPAATMPHASAVLPVMLVYSPGGQVGRADLEAVADGLGGLAEVVAGEERRPVGGWRRARWWRSASRSSRASARSGGCTSTTRGRGRRSSSSARRRAA